MFDTIPLERPPTPLLDTIDSPEGLRQLEETQLLQLADELREYLTYSVGQSGGHFGAGLGVVELTIALHYVLNTPEDRIVWDVGHQTYPHKILTGRRNELKSIRRHGGIAGFPKRSESEFDTFGVGHSSTSISAALGMAIASSMDDNQRKSVAVIGDGSMTAGMAFEALNHTAHTRSDVLVILNDNSMSISPNVGGLATYFSKIWASKLYISFRENGKKVLKSMPSASELVRRTEEHMKGMVSPGTLFEELGFYYVGPIDGHDVQRLIRYLNNLKDVTGPKLLHVITQKGKGFAPAEKDPVGYHALNKIEPKQTSTSTEQKTQINDKGKKYQAVFGEWLCDTAADDQRLLGITPAMCEGSGMVEFAERFSDRFHDVAIAEQHAVTFAAGLACEKMKPVVAIYSTFLQRAYDQLIHDVALQNLDVTFAIDRAGLVGEDGPSHCGAFDLSYLNCIPNMIIATPSDENQCYHLLSTAYQYLGPAAVRYPRGKGPGASIDKNLDSQTSFPLGKGQMIRQGKKVCLFNFGVLISQALYVAHSDDYTVCDMRWLKPIDHNLIIEHAQQADLVVTLEENASIGGAGALVTQILAEENIVKPILQLGLPDQFIEHGNREQQLAMAQLDAFSIQQRINEKLDALDIAPVKPKLSISTPP